MKQQIMAEWLKLRLLKTSDTSTITNSFTYSRVPNNRPPRLLIFQFFSTQDIFIPTPPIINSQSFLLTFLSVNSHFHHSLSYRKRNCAVQHNYYELLKHETHVVSVRSHSGYVYSINICNKNDYKTFWMHLCN